MHWARAEESKKEPGEFPGAAFGHKLKMLSCTNLKAHIFAIPSIIDAKIVSAGSNTERHGIAKHQFALIFSVEEKFDLARSRVVRRVANNRNLPSGGPGRLVFRGKHSAAGYG